MTVIGVRTDETGLHARDCPCVHCENGYRPTELERATARRALNLRLAAEAKRKAEEAAKAAGKKPAQRPVWVSRPMPPPLTPEQIEDLRKERERLFGRSGKVSR